MPGRDSYSVLGVSQDATLAQVKTAYRKLARKIHPDKNGGSRESTEAFKELQRAYDSLCDPKTRRQSDEGNHHHKAGSARPSADQTGHGSSRGPSIWPDWPVAVGEDRFWNFHGLLNRKEMSCTKPLEVPRNRPRESIHSVMVEWPETCKACGGRGGAPGAVFHTCDRCLGHGIVERARDNWRSCPQCMGGEEIPERCCPSCGGQGWFWGRRSIDVHVPKSGDPLMQYGFMEWTIPIDPNARRGRRGKLTVFVSEQRRGP